MYMYIKNGGNRGSFKSMNWKKAHETLYHVFLFSSMVNSKTGDEEMSMYSEGENMYRYICTCTGLLY